MTQPRCAPAPTAPRRYEISAAADWSVWYHASERSFGSGPGQHVLSGCQTRQAAEALADLLERAAELREAGAFGIDAARIAYAVAKTMGGMIDLESFEK